MKLVSLEQFPSFVKTARGKKSKRQSAKEAGVQRIAFIRAERGEGMNANTYIKLYEWAVKQ